MSTRPGPALPKIGDWAVVICYDTVGNVVRAAVVLEEAAKIGCGCTRYETTRPSPNPAIVERMSLMSGCRNHKSQLEAVQDDEQVIYRGGFLYPTDEPTVTDPATVVDVRKGGQIAIGDDPHLYKVVDVNRDEYGVYFTIMVSTRTDVIRRAA